MFRVYFAEKSEPNNVGAQIRSKRGKIGPKRVFFWIHFVSSKISHVSPSVRLFVRPSVTKVLILPAIGFLSFFA